jgi:hypothetical protein
MTAPLPADELKKTFRCYGHFYRLRVEGADPQPCRSVLEITSLPRHAVGAAPAPNDLFAPTQADPSRPDAVVIMMNPGSSRPIEEGDTDRLLAPPLPANFPRPLVLTRPDNTQYQIMRIMASKDWKHVRVLNLSDLRDPKSPSFLARIGALDRLPGGPSHSLFCADRHLERTALLDRQPGAPLILGWGQAPGLLPLAEQCLRCIAGERTVAVPAGDHPALTAHPSPMLQSKKEEWLDAVLAAL